MSERDKSSSDASRMPVAPTKALPVNEKPGEKMPAKPAETQNVSEKKDAKPQKTNIEIKKEVLQGSKKTLDDKRKKLINASQKETDEDAAQKDLLSWSDAPKSPHLPSLSPQKSETFLGKNSLQKTESPNGVELSALQKREQAQKELQEQENKTAEAIKGKMDAELESVTKTGKIDQLTPETQTKIRTEAVRVSIDPQKLPKSVLLAVKGADGKALFNEASFDDKGEIKPESITRYKRDLVLGSDAVKDLASRAVDEYKKIQDEAQKTGKKADPELVKKLQSQIGLPSPNALELSQLRPGMKPIEYPADTQIGIVQRVLAEETFKELRSTLSNGFKWSHIPDLVKREIVTDSFLVEPDKNPRVINQSIIEAKKAVSSGKGADESDVQYASRIKEAAGVSSTDLNALSLEAKKSGLSPMIGLLADFFGPIGAALGMPFWQEYMSGRQGGDDDFDNNVSERWKGDSKGEKAEISRGVLRSNKEYLDSGKGFKSEGGSYEVQASNASEFIRANKERYMRVAEKTGVPWELIGAIHYRESDFNFNACLHNGDKIIGNGKKTWSVPEGRGPFATWEESAIDALNMKGQLGFSEITQTSQLEQVAGYAEKYNGFGYRNNGVSSAYVWSGTEAYTGGMYVADGVFDRNKKDEKPGVMPIIAKLIPESIRTEKRTPDASSIAPTAGSFGQEFQSAPFERSSTGTTLCSQTARKNLYTLLGRQEDIPRGNANTVHDIYGNGSKFGDMVGPYASSFSPPENANVADISLTSGSQYGHRVAAYKGPSGWMVLDPYNGGSGVKPQPWDSYVKKNNVRGVAFYQKNLNIQNNTSPNQAPKSAPNTQGPVIPDTSGDAEGAKSDVFRSREGTAFVGDSHFNFLTGNLGYTPYGKSKKLPGQSTVEIPTVMSGGNMGNNRLSVSQLITSPLGREYLQNKKDIVVCLGTNDATMFRADQMIANMTKLVSNIRAINPEGKIIVVTPPLNRNPTINAKIAEYEEMLLDQEGSLGIKVAPFYTYSTQKNLQFRDKDDDDHLNTVGYQEMKRYINTYI